MEQNREGWDEDVSSVVGLFRYVVNVFLVFFSGSVNIKMNFQVK